MRISWRQAIRRFRGRRVRTDRGPADTGLEDAAPGSRAARAALRSASELSVLLAGVDAVGTQPARRHPGVRAAMRDTRSHLALVLDEDGEVTGLLTLTDVLQRLLPAAP